MDSMKNITKSKRRTAIPTLNKWKYDVPRPPRIVLWEVDPKTGARKREIAKVPQFHTGCIRDRFRTPASGTTYQYYEANETYWMLKTYQSESRPARIVKFDWSQLPESVEAVAWQCRVSRFQDVTKEMTTLWNIMVK